MRPAQATTRDHPPTKRKPHTAAASRVLRAPFEHKDAAARRSKRQNAALSGPPRPRAQKPRDCSVACSCFQRSTARLRRPAHLVRSNTRVALGRWSVKIGDDRTDSGTAALGYIRHSANSLPSVTAMRGRPFQTALHIRDCRSKQRFIFETSVSGDNDAQRRQRALIDPVADRLLVQLENRRDLGDGQELVVEVGDRPAPQRVVVLEAERRELCSHSV